MDAKKSTIRIESILGGHAPFSHFASADQFRSSTGIDPSLPANNFNDNAGIVPSGLLRPVSVAGVGTTAAAPMWIDGSPKSESVVYIYDAVGSVFTCNQSFGSFTGLADLNDGGSASGNGMAYYNNYMYFARDTTIARYGPLSGTPVFTDDYWVGTLGKAQLSDTPYQTEPQFSLQYPNHPMFRHSDGRLYILDVNDNKGIIHFIKTTKVTVEGDTDDGSTYGATEVGYGLWPTAIESYGSQVAIAFNEMVASSTSVGLKSTRSKVAFWDTISDRVNQITWVEFPDQMITAMKNLNGVLYFVSGNQMTLGARITRYIGGYSFGDIGLIPTAIPCFPGAIDGNGDRLVIGSWSFVPKQTGSVFSYGISAVTIPGNFNTVTVAGHNGDNTISRSNVLVTALKLLGLSNHYSLNENQPVLGYHGSTYKGVLQTGEDCSGASPIWWSQVYRIGQPFKITKIRIPMAMRVGANMIVTPKFHVDDYDETTLTTIDNTNFPGKKNVVLRPEALVGQNSFWLELSWTGSALAIVGLPITIEYELLDD